jgi:hypothetical protein
VVPGGGGYGAVSGTPDGESGASVLKIQETSRHKSTDVLAGYVRRVDLFKEHAGGSVPVMTAGGLCTHLD